MLVVDDMGAVTMNERLCWSVCANSCQSTNCHFKLLHLNLSFPDHYISLHVNTAFTDSIFSPDMTTQHFLTQYILMLCQHRIS